MPSKNQNPYCYHDISQGIAFIGRNQGAIMALVKKWATPIMDKDDIVHEIAIVASEAISRYDKSKGNLDSYLFVSVRNRIMDASLESSRPGGVRGSTVRKIFSGKVNYATTIDVAPTLYMSGTDANIPTNDNQFEMVDFLDTLNKIDPDGIIWRKKVLGQTWGRIAKELNQSTFRLKTKFKTGMQKLKVAYD